MRTLLFTLIVLFAARCHAEQVFVELSHVPQDGLVVCPLDMTPAAHWLKTNLLDDTEFYYSNTKLEAVFVPDPGNAPNRGTLVALLPDNLPKDKPIRLRLENSRGYGKKGEAVGFFRPFTATAASTNITFDKEKQGGLPSSITFANGKTLDTMKWFDRLYDPDIGSCNIANVALNSNTVIDERPFLHVVPAAADFQGANASVQYQWFIFPDRELIYVIAFMEKSEAREWKEKASARTAHRGRFFRTMVRRRQVGNLYRHEAIANI